MDNPHYLSIRNLTISFKNAPKPTIRDVSFDIALGETLALVGGSGEGKTLIATSIARLLPNVLISGEIILDHQSVLSLSPSELLYIRRHKISYVFQEPGAALNPSLTIGYQLLEIMDGPQKKRRIWDMFHEVGFSDPKKIFNTYPHELSGGMQQRVMIALALINHPKLLIADEPTTAIDIVLQTQILALIQLLQKKFGFAILLITHDFSLLQQIANYVCVLHDGHIVERGTPDDIIFNPKHPYTQLLADSIFVLPKFEGQHALGQSTDAGPNGHP